MMEKISTKDLTNLKLRVNPPRVFVDAGYKVIHNGKIKCWVGIGWVEEREATPKDFEKIPEVKE